MAAAPVMGMAAARTSSMAAWSSGARTDVGPPSFPVDEQAASATAISAASGRDRLDSMAHLRGSVI